MNDKISEYDLFWMRKRICKKLSSQEKKSKRKTLPKPDLRQMTIFEIIDKVA